MSLPEQPRRAGSIIKVILIFLLTLSFSVSICTAERQTDTKELEQQKNQLESRQKKISSLLNKKRLEKSRLTEIFREVDAELTRTDREFRRKNVELRNAQLEEQYYKKQLKTSRERFVAHRDQYKDRLVAYYKNGRSGYMEVLFNSTSLDDFISRMTYIRILTKSDLETIEKLKKLREEVAEKSRKVEDARTEIELARNSLAQEKDHIAAIHREKRKAVRIIGQDVALLEKQYAELERENRIIESELQRARGLATQYRFDGRFGNPVCNRAIDISSYFGYRKAPRRGASKNHHGIDIRVPGGADICAAADGVVFQAGRRSGYGITVILLHGSDYASLYAHGQRVLVREGQQVRRGQVIMKADSTGISTGDHLHFEVRKSGVAINPIGYFR